MCILHTLTGQSGLLQFLILTSTTYCYQVMYLHWYICTNTCQHAIRHGAHSVQPGLVLSSASLASSSTQGCQPASQCVQALKQPVMAEPHGVTAYSNGLKRPHRTYIFKLAGSAVQQVQADGNPGRSLPCMLDTSF